MSEALYTQAFEDSGPAAGQLFVVTDLYDTKPVPVPEQPVAPEPDLESELQAAPTAEPVVSQAESEPRPSYADSNPDVKKIEKVTKRIALQQGRIEEDKEKNEERRTIGEASVAEFTRHGTELLATYDQNIADLAARHDMMKANRAVLADYVDSSTEVRQARLELRASLAEVLQTFGDLMTTYRSGLAPVEEGMVRAQSLYDTLGEVQSMANMAIGQTQVSVEGAAMEDAVARQKLTSAEALQQQYVAEQQEKFKQTLANLTDRWNNEHDPDAGNELQVMIGDNGGATDLAAYNVPTLPQLADTRLLQQDKAKILIILQQKLAGLQAKAEALAAKKTALSAHQLVLRQQTENQTTHFGQAVAKYTGDVSPLLDEIARAEAQAGLADRNFMEAAETALGQLWRQDYTPAQSRLAGSAPAAEFIDHRPDCIELQIYAGVLATRIADSLARHAAARQKAETELTAMVTAGETDFADYMVQRPAERPVEAELPPGQPAGLPAVAAEPAREERHPRRSLRVRLLDEEGNS